MGKETVVQPVVATPDTQADKTEVQAPIKTSDTSVHTAIFAPPTPLPSDGTTPEKVEGDSKDKPVTMTQTEMDRIIASRLEQERKKYADYDQVKAELAKLKTPAVADVANPVNPLPKGETTDQLSTLEASNQELAKKNRELVIETAVTKQAAMIGLDTTAATKLVDIGKLAIGEDGKVTGVEEAVKALAEQYPGLLAKQAQRTRPVNPGRAGEVGRTDDDRRREYFSGGGNPFWSGGGVVNDED